MFLSGMIQWISIVLLFTAWGTQGSHMYSTIQCKDTASVDSTTSAQIYLSNLLGVGGCGEVYRGTLYGRTLDDTFVYEEVAVKIAKSKTIPITAEYNLQVELQTKLTDLKKQNPDPEKQITAVETYFGNFGGVGRIYKLTFETSDGFDGMAKQILGQSIVDDAFINFCVKYPRLFWNHVAPQMAACILELHSVDFVHCDVKPENFLFGSGDSKNLIYITDFGSSGFTINGSRDITNSLCTPSFMSINALEEMAYTYKDDYTSLIYNWIWLFFKATLPWQPLDGEVEESHFASKINFRCVNYPIPGGAALDKFLDWAQSKTSRCEKPEPKRIWAFIEDIQKEVQNLNEGIDLRNIDGADKIYQIPISSWEVYPTITAKYFDTKAKTINAALRPKSRLLMRLEGIVAQIVPTATSTSLPVDFAVQYQSQAKEFVSLLPGIHNLIITRCHGIFGCVIFTENKEMAGLAAKFGLFVRYNIAVVTLDTLLKNTRHTDTILESTTFQSKSGLTGNIDLIQPLDLATCSPDNKEKLFNDWRDKIVNKLDLRQADQSSGFLDYITSYFW